jgi:hypothetical protein
MFSVNSTLKTRLWAFAAAILMPAAILSDTTDVRDSSAADSSQVDVSLDTVLFDPPPDKAVAGQVTNPIDLEGHLYQKPTVALFKSLFVPGLGQLGNHRYLKAAFFAGIEGWFIGSVIHYGRQAADAKQLFENAPTTAVRNHWYSFYDNKRKNRNKFAWFAGITIFVSMFDAYVDAHLSGSPTDKRNDRFTVAFVSDDYVDAGATVVFRF